MPNTGQSISPSDAYTATDIKKRMLDDGLTVVALAKAIKKSRDAVSKAIHHPSVVPHVRSQILQHLNLHV